MSDVPATLHNMTSCTKVRYRDRIAALLALATVRTQDKSHRAKVEARAYFCSSCRGWHLTSRKHLRAT
jgi:hypothetical protein